MHLLSKEIRQESFFTFFASEEFFSPTFIVKFLHKLEAGTLIATRKLFLDSSAHWVKCRPPKVPRLNRRNYKKDIYSLQNMEVEKYGPLQTPFFLQQTRISPLQCLWEGRYPIHSSLPKKGGASTLPSKEASKKLDGPRCHLTPTMSFSHHRNRSSFTTGRHRQSTHVLCPRPRSNGLQGPNAEIDRSSPRGRARSVWRGLEGFGPRATSALAVLLLFKRNMKCEASTCQGHPKCNCNTS